MDKAELRKHRLIILETMERHSLADRELQTLGNSLLNMTCSEIRYHKNILEKTMPKLLLSFREYLAQLIQEKGYSRAKICEESELDSSHLAKYLSGTRNPNMDNLLRIIFALRLSEEEGLTLLSLNEMSLKKYDIRDVTIAHCLRNGFTLHNTRLLMIEMKVNPL